MRERVGKRIHIIEKRHQKKSNLKVIFLKCRFLPRPGNSAFMSHHSLSL